MIFELLQIDSKSLNHFDISLADFIKKADNHSTALSALVTTPYIHLFPKKIAKLCILKVRTSLGLL